MEFRCVVIAAVVMMAGLVAANPAASKPAFWKDTPMDGMVREMRSLCETDKDSAACLKLKIMNFLDTVFKKDNFQISDDVEVRGNGALANEARGPSGLVEQVENYLRSHDVTFKLPIADAKVTVSPRNIQNDELSVTFNFPSASTGRGVEARKSKLKKIVIPIMVFILLKAMTLIPMALGVLGLKAWNSLQLSFFSFVVSVGLAIFQLCKKLAADSHHPHIAAHGPWETRRSFANVEQPAFEGQDVAYRAYA
ncbi:AGAP012549-PA-like protein [Anopheles sinensis]|uniref:AGAP012549-PA-like protein n=1 Tax=Anopheles sinensis TaxID=74873 RepID=A0A084WNS3_ANOSI|nr:AGAP012549-PA-like protein [Anopheles sinensis]